MNDVCRKLVLAVSVVAILIVGAPAIAQGQVGLFMPNSTRFELAEAVQLDRADNAVLAQLQRVKAFLADRQWDEAVEALRQVMEGGEGKLLGVTEYRYVGLRDYCQLQLALLPPEALKLYRSRIDPVARKWYDEGVARRDYRLLNHVVEQALASSWGDDALLALGEISLEAGDYAAARWFWERIVPATPRDTLPPAPPQDGLRGPAEPKTTDRAAKSPGTGPESGQASPSSTPPAGFQNTWPGYPDTDLDLAAVRARLVLVSILEGSAARAQEELAQFSRLHGQAQGRLAGRQVNYAEALARLLTESATWQAPPADPEWSTFAGSFARSRVVRQKIDVGRVVWRASLPAVDTRAEAPGLGLPQDHRPALGYYPVVVGGLVLVNTLHEVFAFQAGTGEPAWGQTSTAIYRDPSPEASAPLLLPAAAFGGPRFTMSCRDGRLYARMGNPLSSHGPDGPNYGGGYLICIDLAAQGRLLWRTASEEGWTLEGAPVVDDSGVYVAMRRQDIRPHAYVACLDPQTGRLRWRRFVCAAETPARGTLPEISHNLLTLAGHTLYYNTNLGAVAALDTGDGQIRWVSLYPRALRVDLSRLAPHWRRDLNPCLADRGTLLVAPADSPRIFAFDAASGQLRWQTGEETADVGHLLGATASHLIASGAKLYWIGLDETNPGRLTHVWPQGEDRLGCGRGLVTAESVFWPSRDKIYVFDARTAQPRRVFDLAARGARGGNLIAVGDRLLVATGTELIALDRHGGKVQTDSGDLAAGTWPAAARDDNLASAAVLSAALGRATPGGPTAAAPPGQR